MKLDTASWRAFAVLVAAVALAVGVGVGVEAGLSGRPVAHVPPGGAGVLIAGHGIVWAAANDDVYRSTDGGGHWQATLPPTADPSCGCFGPDYFLGGEDAWTLHYRILAFGSGQVARLWRTTDGGRQWSQGSPLPGLVSPFGAGGVIEFFSMAFATPAVGYVVGYGSPPMGAQSSALSVALWRTDDGGRHFEAVAPATLPMQGVTTPALSSGTDCGGADTLEVTATGTEDLYLSDAGCPSRLPGLWRSTDGGRHFSRLALALPPGAPGKVEVDAPVVLSSRRLIVEVTTGAGHALVYESSDGGRRFGLVSRLSTGQWARPSPLAAASGARWAVPVTDGLEVTSDGGRHWRREDSGVDLASLGPLALDADGAGLITGFSLPDVVALRTTNGGRSWRPSGSTPPAITGSAPYEALAFTSPTTGYLAGAGGLAKTTDGGRTVTLQLPPAEAVEALSFLDATTGVVRTADSVLVTDDGGTRWSAAAEPALAPISAIAFVAHTRELVATACPPDAGRGALFSSGDLGRSWHRLDAGPGNCELPCFTSPSTGYLAVASHPRASASPTQIWQTSDGARSWHLAATVRAAIELAGCTGTTLYASAGEVVGMSGSVFAVYRSTDGGHHFSPVLGFDSPYLPFPGLKGRLPAGDHVTPLALPAGGFVSLSTIGRHTVVVMSNCAACAPTPGSGGSAAIAVSDDGGRTWVNEPADGHGIPDTSGVSAAAASFVSHDVGFVLGGTFDTTSRRSTSVLLETRDGGRRWSKVASYGPLP